MVAEELDPTDVEFKPVAWETAPKALLLDMVASEKVPTDVD